FSSYGRLLVVRPSSRRTALNAVRASDLVRRPRCREIHRAVEDLAGVGEVDGGVGPRRDVGEGQAAGGGPGRGLAGLAAVEMQVRDVLLAVREGGLAQEQVGVPGQVLQRRGDAGVA